MGVTKAGEALRLALDPQNPDRRMSQTELAKLLKVSQPSLSEWVRMRARPESHYRKAIERELGIPEDDWMTDAEREIATGGSQPQLPADDEPSPKRTRSKPAA